MLNTSEKQAYDHFLSVAEQEFVSCLHRLSQDEIDRAATLIQEANAKGNRLHFSGIGKPGHLAGYAASLFSSTGTPAYFLHGTEAVHGSCGQLIPGDVVVFISNSGETPEMKTCISAILQNGCRLIGISGNPDSWLAAHSDAHICASVAHEGGPLDRAPRASILAETLVLQALSVVLQEHAQVTPQKYVCWHPGGKLGQLRDNEK